MSTRLNYTKGQVTSEDGTTIGYRQMGSGPGLILVHGGVMAAQNFMELGSLLADEFAVYIPDRRGRGLSGPFGENYSLLKDGQDMQALTRHIGAQNIFGLSSGAIIALQTALLEPSLKKVAVYEPPISLPGTDHSRMNRKYDAALAEGNLAKAMVTVIKGTGDPSFFTIMPEFITVRLMKAAGRTRIENAAPDNVSLEALVPTFYYDRIIVDNATNLIEESKAIHAAMLLLGGNKSKKFLKQALDALAAALPAAKRVELKGMGHIAASNGEHPSAVAEELREFFKA